MGYGFVESYGILPVTELVDTPNPWVITGYGLSQVWFRTESTVVVIDLVRQIYESPDSDGSCAECCWGSGKGTIASVDEERQMVIMVNPLVSAMKASCHMCSGMILMTNRKALMCGCQRTSSTTVSI